MAQGAEIQVCDNLLDDRVAAMGLLAWSVASGEWVNSSPCPSGTDLGFSRWTRRMINRLLMWSP